jgi:hypothetical protein
MRPFHMFPRLVALTDNRLQPFQVGGADAHTYCLSLRPSIAHYLCESTECVAALA